MYHHQFQPNGKHISYKYKILPTAIKAIHKNTHTVHIDLLYTHNFTSLALDTYQFYYIIKNAVPSTKNDESTAQ